MKNLMISLLVVVVGVFLSACGGSAGANAKANSADGMSSEARVSKTWISGQSSDATMTTDATGEPTETPAPQPTTSNRALPPECEGKLPQAKKMAQGTLVCRCESAGHEAVWATFVWDEGAYPNCKVPYPDQVLTRKVNRPSAGGGAGENPYTDPTPAKKTESSKVAIATSSRTQVTCDSRTEGEKRFSTCLVVKDNQPAQEFTCVGPGVKNMTVAQKMTYSGGPPCTCESGSPQPLGESVPNTWQCK